MTFCRTRVPGRRLGCCVSVVAVLLVACATNDDQLIEEQYQVHLHAGHVALQHDEPGDAADAYRRALRLRPEAAEALYGIVRCHSARGDGRSALTALMRLETEHPAYYRARAATDLRFALYQASKQHLWSGDSARALKLINRLHDLEPGHPGLAELRSEALLREAARYYVGGRAAEAEVLIGDLVGRRVSGAAAALALAEVLVERDRAALAISVLSDASRRYPRDRRLRRLMDQALEIRYPNMLPEPVVAPPEPEAAASERESTTPDDPNAVDPAQEAPAHTRRAQEEPS